MTEATVTLRLVLGEVMSSWCHEAGRAELGRAILCDDSLRGVLGDERLPRNFGARIAVHLTQPPAPVADVVAALIPGDGTPGSFHRWAVVLGHEREAPPRMFEAGAASFRIKALDLPIEFDQPFSARFETLYAGEVPCSPAGR